MQHRYGELRLLVRPAEVLADTAAQVLQQALDQGEALTAADRGAVAIAVAEAKVQPIARRRGPGAGQLEQLAADLHGGAVGWTASGATPASTPCTTRWTTSCATSAGMR